MTTPEEQGHRRRFLLVWRQAFDFSGRATRTDVIVFWFAMVALGVLIDVTTSLLPLPENAVHRIDVAAEWLLLLPFPALFIRRAHDHGFSGWWVLAPLFVAGRGAALSLVAKLGGTDARVALDERLFLLDGAALLAALAALAIIAAPGDAGPNRFGPDPRNPA